MHFVKGSDRKPQVLGLVGMGTAGPWVATARAQASEAIDRAVIDTRGFRFGKVMDIQSIDFLPGGAKYGDVPTLLALGAPGKLWLTGEGKQAPPVVRPAINRRVCGRIWSIRTAAARRGRPRSNGCWRRSANRRWGSPAHLPCNEFRPGAGGMRRTARPAVHCTAPASICRKVSLFHDSGLSPSAV